MEKKEKGLQDQLLAKMRRSRSYVTMFLMNGFQLKGQIERFDAYVVLLIQNDGRQHMVYKHAISTIVPEVSVPLDKEE